MIRRRCFGSLRASVLAAFVSLMAILPAASDGLTGRRFPICTDPGDQAAPTVSGTVVVWVDGSRDGGDIWGRDLSTGDRFPVSLEDGVQSTPDIDGNTVVWQDWPPGAGHPTRIRGMDLRTGQVFTVCEESDVSVGCPSIFWPTVVWVVGNPVPQGQDLWGKALSTGEVFPVCTEAGDLFDPHISGRIVAYQYGHDFGQYVYARDLDTGQVYDFEGGQGEGWARQYGPDIHGDLVVWWTGWNNAVCYGRRLPAEAEFLVSRWASGWRCCPAPWGDIVAYSNSDDWSNNIEAADLSSGAYLTLAPWERFKWGGGVNYSVPVVSGDLVVWCEDRYGGDGADVWGCDLSGDPDDPGDPNNPDWNPFLLDVYRGNLHSHTKYSDAHWGDESANPGTAFAYAQTQGGLGFLAATDHTDLLNWDSNWNANDEWQWTGAHADAYTAPGSFVALRGFEWGKDDHICVSGTDTFVSHHGGDDQPPRDDPDVDLETNDLRQFYAWIASKPEAVGQFNHARWADLWHPWHLWTHRPFDDMSFDPRADTQMALFEVGSGEGLEHIGYKTEEDWFIQALNQGWHVAPTNNQDNHFGRYGDANDHRTGAWANRLDTSGLLSALARRRTFASEDKDAYLYHYGNGGSFMGAGAPGSTPVPALLGEIDFDIVAESPDGIREVLVFSNTDPGTGNVCRGPTMQCYVMPADYDMDAGVWRATVPWAPSAWYFVRARTSAWGDNLIYGAPVWTGRGPWPVAKVVGRSWYNPEHTVVKVDFQFKNQGDMAAWQFRLDAPQVLWSSGGQVTFNEELSGVPPYDLGKLNVGDTVTKSLYFNAPGQSWLFLVVLRGSTTDWNGSMHDYANLRLIFPPGAGAAAPLGDTWTVELVPASGQGWAEPGQAALWGYTATNESPDKWLVLTGVNANVWQRGVAEPVLENPLVSPGGQVSGVLYRFTWEPDAPLGFGNVGAFDIEAAWFSDAGGQPGQYLGEAGDVTLPYSVVVAERATAPGGFFNPGWNWFSIPMHPADGDPTELLDVNCSGKLWRWDKYGKWLQVYRPPFATFELSVGDSSLLRLDSTPQPPSYLGYEANHPFEYRLGRMGWTWMAMPRLEDMPGQEFMSTVVVEYPSGSGNRRTAREDYNATPGNWMSWAWSFYDSKIQAPMTFTPYAPFGNRTCQPWVGYRAWVKVGSAEFDSDPDQVTLIWP